jgi:hypothetical protein
MSKRIEFLEDVKLSEHGFCGEGDVRTLPDDVAKTCIDAGWAKCTETGECGERIPGSRIINDDGSLGAGTSSVKPNDIKQKVS